MRIFLLSTILLFTGKLCIAQDKPLNALPIGKYETFLKNSPDKWDRGDIIILNDNKYKISTSEIVGEYRFSATAQRVFFTSGPLKSAYAKTSLSNNGPAIIFPTAENEHMGMKLTSEIWSYLKL